MKLQVNQVETLVRERLRECLSPNQLEQVANSHVTTLANRMMDGAVMALYETEDRMILTWHYPPGKASQGGGQ